jgi:Dolichyl-phosphate-mannose-protein mannosyltransferase
MAASKLAESPAAAGPSAAPGSVSPAARWSWVPVAIVVLLSIVGVVFRIVVAGQSLFADELSTYWISATHGLGEVLKLLYSVGSIKHAEITPPLYFVLAWITAQIGHGPDLLRLPSLIAGTATIPVVYLLGVRTVGRRAALVATAATAVAPFTVYYSADARAYAVMILAVTVSTLGMLLALDTGRARWWVLYAVAACSAFYSHYTCAFVLGAQWVWVMWAHPAARRAAVIATAGAAAGVLPWLPGLINDYQSPTVKILNALSPFTFSDIRIDLTHWVIGYPETFAGGLTHLPGTPALVLFAVAAAIGAAGLVWAIARRPSRFRPASADRRVVLVVGLALVTPVAEVVLGAAGHSLISVRDLGASWPFLALTGAAALNLCEPRVAMLAAALAVAALVIGSATMLGGEFQRPAYRAAAGEVTAQVRPGDVIIDETGALSPGPLTGLDVALGRPLPLIRAEAPAEQEHPFGFADPIVSLQQAVAEAVRRAGGHRVFLVRNAFVTDIASLAGRVAPAQTHFPARYRLTAQRAYPGIGGTVVDVYSSAHPARR